jgi:N-acetylglucosamine-6-phosphate deacetylase
MPTDVVLAGARVVAGGRVLDPGYVVVRNDRIDGVGEGLPPDHGHVVDLGGRWLLPGYIDLHVHGGGGGSLAGADHDQHVTAAGFHGRHGTTSLLATTVSSSPAHLQAAIAAIRDTMREPVTGARILGINMEGPYLSVECRGAHDPALVRDPDLEEFARLVEIADGALRIITVAPERPGASELVAAARAAGVVVSIGHTAAPYDVALAAVDRGASLVTHMFNGMYPLHHRAPGTVGAGLNAPHLTCELIADGMHVDPAVVGMLIAAKGIDRIALITDCMHAAGLPEGDYDMGEGRRISLAGGLARVAGSDTIAGSTLTMGEAVQNVVRFTGVGIVAASRMASENQARLLQCPGVTGRIVTDSFADLVVLDDALAVQATMVGGIWIHGDDVITAIAGTSRSAGSSIAARLDR